MSERERVKEYDWDTHASDLIGSVGEIIEHLQNLKEKYGEDCGYEGMGEYEDWTLKFYFHRDETNKEREKRIKLERKIAKKEAAKLAKNLAKNKELWESLKEIAKEQGWE